MKRLMIIALLALFSFLSFTNDAAARRGRFYYGLSLGLLFHLPLHSAHRHYHSPEPYYGHHDGYSNSIYMNDSDRFLLSEKTNHTLENVRSGTEVIWFNPNTGIEGTVVARPAFKNSRGQFCRAYEQIIRYGRWTRRGVDTACRLPDGRWENIPNY